MKLQALASSEVLVSFMEECSRMNCGEVVESVQSTMPLAVAVSALFNGTTFFSLLPPFFLRFNPFLYIFVS